MSVVRTDGRAVGVRSRDYQIFSDGPDYHIFLAMGLRAARRAPLLCLSFSFKTIYYINVTQASMVLLLSKEGIYAYKRVKI